MKQKNKKPISELLKKKQGKKQSISSSSSSSKSKTDDEYENSSDAEDIEDYKKDGYHPVQIGEQFHNGRFQVIQKLGWGHFSTVWLVYDKEQQIHHALKIQKSKQSYQESAQDELELLNDLKLHEQDQQWQLMQKEIEGYQKSEMHWNSLELKEINKDEQIITKLGTYCVRIIDNFIHFGMHGKHYCTVFEVLGPSLLDLIIHFDDYNKKMGIWLVKQITREILIGLSYMHDVCKMIHTDLKPENIMLQLKDQSFGEFVEQMKMYQKKPISMKFLTKLKQSKNGSKKQEKKKKQALKKLQQQADLKLQQQQQQQQQQQVIQLESQETIDTKDPNEKQILENQQNIVQAPLILTNENEQFGQSVAEIIQPQPIEIPITSQYSTSFENISTPLGDPYLQSVEIVSKEPLEVHHQHKHINREQEKKEKEKGKKKSVDNDKDSEQWESDEDQQSSLSESESRSDSTKEVDQETLYTLVWKDHIKLKLDRDISIKIVDFGNACWTHKHFTDNIQTREYRSPEAILGMNYDTSTDIWSLACVVYELLTNEYLFKPRKGKGYKKSEDHLAQMQEVLGKMSKKFALGGTYSRDFFNKNGQLTNIKQLHESSLCQVLIEEEGFSQQDAMEIEDFLKPMLQYEGNKRVSARQALKHPWLWCI